MICEKILLYVKNKDSSIINYFKILYILYIS